VTKVIVSDKTINRVLSWLAENESTSMGNARGSPDSLLNLGVSMLELNCKALDKVYGSGEAAQYRPLDYEFRWERVPEIQVLKSLQCWLEQCSVEELTENDLYRRMKAVEHTLASKVVSNLEAYATAEWG
jgi:hypothetical protein